MKQYLLSLMTFFALFMLSACGGGGSSSSSGQAPAPTASALELYSVQEIVTNTAGTQFALKLHLQKNLDDNYLVELSDMGLQVDGCDIDDASLRFSPTTVQMAGNKLSKQDIDVSGTFSSACTVKNVYTFSATQKLTLGGKTESSRIGLSSKAASSPTGGGTTAYSIKNVSTPITVNYDKELKTISADVINGDGIGVSGIDVNITAVQGIEFGSIIGGSTQTSDSSGHVFFSYQAPENVAAVDGQSSTVTLSILGQTKSVTLKFEKLDANNTISVPIVVISDFYKEIILTGNGANTKVEIQVYEQGTNTPYITGNVKVSLPNKVLTGTDVGSFSAYTVPVGANGKAIFNYTAPQDIKSLIDSNDSSASFRFYHESNPTQQVSVTVKYELKSDYIPVNYVLSTTSSDDKQTMGLNLLKSFTLYLENVKNEQDTIVPNKDITKVIIESKNTLIGKLIDVTTGNEVDTLTFNGDDAVNSQSFNVKTNTLSGLLPVEITVVFKDANEVNQTLTANTNIVVLSGPPTAMSISYAGVEQNKTVAKYIEKFVVTVTDTYNNPVNTQPYIATGAIVEYAVDGSSTISERTTTSPRLWHGSDDSHGTLEALGGDAAQFTTTSDAFNYVDPFNDRLVVFGKGFVYEALGKWDIDNIANQLLGLKDNYYGTTRDGLYFAVGHNNRQDLCSNDGREYVGNMKATNVQLDDSGHALLEFEYDYHLTGKDIMVWVNLVGFQADNGKTGRIGEAQKHTLRGAGFTSPESYTLAGGVMNANLRFTVWHENAPEAYHNGHFNTGTKGKCTVERVDDWSNNHDARDCDNRTGYIELIVSNYTTGDCTIKLKDESIVVTPEFNGVTYP